jgi:predicted SAM-dependent methyltransferase
VKRNRSVYVPEKQSVKKIVKLDIACGQNKQEGFFGIDIAAAPGVDLVHDLNVHPWPIKTESVSEARASHYFEHVPGRLRPAFMEDLWRVLVPGGKCLIIVPYWSSVRATQDWTHEWPPLSENSFLYWNAAWLAQNKLDHGSYVSKANFNFTFGYMPSPEHGQRQEEARSFAFRNYVNAISDVWVTIEKIPLPGAELAAAGANRVNGAARKD